MKLSDIAPDDILVFNEMVPFTEDNVINGMEGCYLYVMDDEQKN